MWHTSNIHADNDITYPSVQMRLSADFVTLYNPITNCTEHTEIKPSNLGAAINATGPGFRDSVAYNSGDVVWFYFIWGSSVGISTINSKTGPVDLNSNGIIGPLLPTGYTSYAPAFPVPMIDSATLKPMMLGQGASNIQIRGNTVNYPNPPVIEGIGYPTMTFDLSKWIPTQALLSHFLVDAELRAPANGPVIGGMVCSTPSGNFLNQSLYPTTQWWAASDVDVWTVLPTNRQMTTTFLHSGPIAPDNAVCVIFVNGYTFSN